MSRKQELLQRKQRFCNKYRDRLLSVEFPKYKKQMSEECVELIQMARKQIGYSDKTVWHDILTSIIAEASRDDS